VVWTFVARLADPSMYEREVVECREGESRFEAHWVPFEVFVRGEATLFPEGLLELLTKRV
jgi:hypothetical protein